MLPRIKFKGLVGVAGFTLIELITVILILSVLSAFALPRFMDLRGDATQAATKALGGAVRDASDMMHLKCMATPSCVSALGSWTQTLVYQGTSYQLLQGYYDAGESYRFDQIHKAVNASSEFLVTYGLFWTRWTHVSAQVQDSCYVQYTQANWNVPPLIETVSTGC